MIRLIKFIFHIEHLFVVIVTFILLGMLYLITFNVSFLSPVAKALSEFSVTDIFFEIENSGTAIDTCDVITIVDMTELHDRGDIAELINEIGMCNPICVGVDLIFEGEKDDKLGNELLEDAVQGLSGKSVYTTKLTNYSTKKNQFSDKVSSYFTNRLQVDEGFANITDNMEKNRIREASLSLRYRDTLIYSFPVRISMMAGHEYSSKSLSKNILINYRNVAIPVIKYDEIIENTDLIDNHIVLIGTTHEEQDMHLTPLGKMSGIKIQAYTLLTLLERKPIKSVPSWVNFIVAFLFCYIVEVLVTGAYCLLSRKRTCSVRVFFAESNVVRDTTLLIMILLFCLLVYALFIRYSIVFEATVTLALLAIFPEGREMYAAIAKTINYRMKGKFKGKSLFAE